MSAPPTHASPRCFEGCHDQSAPTVPGRASVDLRRTGSTVGRAIGSGACAPLVSYLHERPPSSPTNPLQRGKFTWVVARQPSDELAIGQQPCDQSREHNALKYSEPLCAAVFCDSRGATQAHLQLQTRRCHERRSACVAEDRAQGRLYRMEPGLGPRCGKRQRDRVLPPDTCALRVTYPHNADSILESLARSPRMARDG